MVWDIPTTFMSKVTTARRRYRKIQMGVALHAQKAESRFQRGTDAGEMTYSGLNDLSGLL